MQPWVSLCRVAADGQMQGSPCLPRIPAAVGAQHTCSPAGQINILAKMLDAVTRKIWKAARKATREGGARLTAVFSAGTAGPGWGERKTSAQRWALLTQHPSPCQWPSCLGAQFCAAALVSPLGLGFPHAKRAPFLSDPLGALRSRDLGSVCCIVSGGNLGTFTELSVGARPWLHPTQGPLSSGNLLLSGLALVDFCLHGYLRGSTTPRLCSLGRVP